MEYLHSFIRHEANNCNVFLKRSLPYILLSRIYMNMITIIVLTNKLKYFDLESFLSIDYGTRNWNLSKRTEEGQVNIACYVALILIRHHSQNHLNWLWIKMILWTSFPEKQLKSWIEFPRDITSAGYKKTA